jgi:hypothetical protein
VQQRFGSSSEKLGVDQINLFDEAELLSDGDAPDEEESTSVHAHKRKKIVHRFQKNYPAPKLFMI